MLRFFGFICLLLVLPTSLLLAQEVPSAVGMELKKIPADGRYRALEVAFFYPAQYQTDSKLTLVADNPAFYGVQVIENGQLFSSQSPYPLVVISHGFGGSWRNQIWLAEALVKRGFVVASINHPGSTTRDVNPEKGAALWKRVWDISRVIDQALANPTFANAIDAEKVAIIGHSFGGWTAIAAIGGRLDAQRLADYCQQAKNTASCLTVAELEVDLTPANQVNLGQDLRDKRIKAAVSLDLGLSQSFTPQSLSEIQVPALIMVAEEDPLMPIADESGYLQQHMPTALTTYMPIRFAAHFSFIQRCKAGAIELLREESPGDEKICLPENDQKEIRAQLQQQVIEAIDQFLKQSL